MRRGWVMSRGGVCLAVLAIAAAASCSRDLPQPYISLDGPAPSIADAPASRALLVSFWATWCVPCQAETSELKALAAAPPRDLAVVIASHDQTMTAVEAFLGGTPDPTLHLRIDEDQRLARAVNVATLPTSVLIVDGRLVARFDGRRQWNSDAERGLLTRLIGERQQRATP